MSGNMTDLLNGPAGVPPAGTISQLDNPPSHKTATHVLPPLSIVLVSLVVAMRMYTSVFVTRRVGVADYSLLLALGFFIGFAIMCVLAGKIAPGLHLWDVRLVHLSPFLYYLRIASVLYGPPIFFIRLSVLSQYVQVFMPNKQPRYLYWTTILPIGACLFTHMILWFLEIWSCTPMRKSWDVFVTGGHCLDTSAINIGTSSINVVSDSVILIMPQVVIWRLHMPTKQKVAVSMMFFIAILAIVSAAVRVHYAIALTRSTDETYFTWMMGIWALFEMDFGFIVACLPAAGACYRDLSQKFSTILTSLRRVADWRKMSAAKDTSAYDSEERKQAGPYLDAEGIQNTTQGKSWVKAYGVVGLDTLASVDEPQPAQDAELGQCGHHVGIEH